MRGAGARTIVLAALALAGACSRPSDQDAPVNLMTGRPDPEAAGKPFDFREKSDLLDFSYSYPAAAAAIPKLVTRFEADLRDGKADALGVARQDRQARTDNGAPFTPHSLKTKWTVRGTTRGFMSLLAEKFMFSGGAHGMTGYDALIWDRQAEKDLSLAAMMTSPDAFSAAVRARFCDALDAERAKRRGKPVVRDEGQFTQCLDPLNQTLVPTSSEGKSFDGLLVMIGPYQAGPYAEGSYAIALPANPSMINAIRPEYRAAFHAVVADPPKTDPDYSVTPVDGGVSAPVIP
jgi:hypothetical protein